MTTPDAPTPAGTGPAVDRTVTRAAVRVLEANWTGTHTLPSTGLYPHQWSWDSGFIAMGLRHLSAERAQLELESLTRAQWADGRLPQIVYDVRRDDDYAPGAAFWGSPAIVPPPPVPTAGLVQPPNHAWAAWEVHAADPGTSVERGFLPRVYPRLVAWHEYLHARRDRAGRGLASVVHPWESGMDNSPLWDDALERVPGTPRTELRRPDLEHADLTERPSTKEYGKYFWLAEHYRDRGCDDADGLDRFVLEDPTFNTLWAVSEHALARIAAAIGADPAPHRARAAAITAALETLYDDALGLYVARDVLTGEPVPRATVSGLVPLLLTDLPHADRLLATLGGPRFLGSGAVMVPSYDVTAQDFQAAQYWRGPAWFNMTWLVIRGLRAHGATPVADALSGTARRLAVEHGFPEYVDPLTGAPHGARSFSWTAALAVDLEASDGAASPASAAQA
jgi:hypothetical protein